MSFSEYSNNSPHTHSPTLFKDHLFNRYMRGCMAKTDLQLEKQYPLLLMRLEQLRFQVDKAFERKMKNRRQDNDRPSRDKAKCTVVQQQPRPKNTELMLQQQKQKLERLKLRLEEISKQGYRSDLDDRIQKVQTEITKIKKQIRQHQRNVHVAGNELTRVELERDYEQLLKSVQNQKNRIENHVRKNDELRRELEFGRRRRRGTEGEQVEVLKQVVPRGVVVLEPIVKKTTLIQTKKKQLKELKSTVRNLDDKIRLVENYISDNQVIKSQLEKLVSEGRQVSQSQVNYYK